MLTVDKRRNVFHRARSVQGVHRDEVFKLVGLQLAQVFLHAHTFKLERAGGFTALKKLVGLQIVQRNVVYIDIDAMAFLDIRRCRVDDDKVVSPRKSIFSMPALSTTLLSNWVTSMSESLAVDTGRTW